MNSLALPLLCVLSVIISSHAFRAQPLLQSKRCGTSINTYVRVSTEADAQEICDLLRASVRELGSAFYTQRQIDAWVSVLPSVCQMSERLSESSASGSNRTAWVAVTADCDGSGDNLVIQGMVDLVMPGISMESMDAARTITTPAIPDVIGLVDFLYVHPNHVRKAVASKLYEVAKRHALAANCSHMETMASECAVQFFRRHGFVDKVTQRNIIVIGDARLWNYRLVKVLEPLRSKGADKTEQ